MPKIIRKQKLPNDKPKQKGRPPKKLNIIDDDNVEDETINNNIIVQLNWGKQIIEL